MAQEQYRWENETESEQEVSEPKLYKVILLNDDYTSMEFVVVILKKIFKKSMEEATALMLKIHQSGSAVCGIYSYEIAQSKVEQVRINAKANQFPLRAQLEEES